MVNEYTPTTDEVRVGWIVGETRDGHGVDHEDLVPEVSAEFDRWLAGVKADAWDEGYRAGSQDMSDLRAGRLTFQTITSNPYRNREDRHVDQ